MQISLNCLQPGKQATVESIAAEQWLAERLQDFGFVPGTCVRCRYRNPSGQVTALGFRGTVVALRTEDLKQIQVRL